MLLYAVVLLLPVSYTHLDVYKRQQVYAVDVSGIDVNNADKNTISALLTDENKLGSTNITGTRGDWNNYLDNNIVLSSEYTLSLIHIS